MLLAVQAHSDDIALLDDDGMADRKSIKAFILARSRALGQKHGGQYAEEYHPIGGGTWGSAVDGYVKKNAVPMK